MSKAKISTTSIFEKIERRVESGALIAPCWKVEWRSKLEKWIAFVDKPVLDFFLANPTIIVSYLNRILPIIPSSRLLEEANAFFDVPDSIWDEEDAVLKKPFGHFVTFAVNWGNGVNGEMSKLAANLLPFSASAIDFVHTYCRLIWSICKMPRLHFKSSTRTAMRLFSIQRMFSRGSIPPRFGYVLPMIRISHTSQSSLTSSQR